MIEKMVEIIQLWGCLPAYKIFLSLDKDIAVTARVGSPNMTAGGPSDPPE